MPTLTRKIKKRGAPIQFGLVSIGLTGGLAAMTGSPPMLAEGNDVVISEIVDFSRVYSDGSGPGAVDAMRMTIADFGGTVLGKTITVLVRASCCSAVNFA